MTRGICVLAFGEEYDRLAAHTVAYSRQFISCPITVLSNLKIRNKKWNEIPGINFIDLDIPTEENRRVKIELYKYTPYDETIYLDVDSIVTKPGIEKMFDGLNNNDIVFQQHTFWKQGKRYYKIYAETMKRFNVSLPLCVALGGFWAFKKTEETETLFKQWLSNWIETGKGRDMPSLACAIKQTGIRHSLVYKAIEKLFSFGMTSDCVVVHRVYGDDLKTFGIPKHKQNKPFDVGHRDNWDMVYFDEDDNAIINDPWIIKKFDRKKRMAENGKYISTFLPEIKNGGLDILDIAAGPGEFLEIVDDCGCNGLGIEITYPATGNVNADKYVRFSRLKHIEKNLKIIYADINEVINNGHEVVDSKKYDIINCKHAINFFPAGCFDFSTENGEYKNGGSWVFGEAFDAWFKRYFEWCSEHIKSNGVVIISCLLSKNSKEFSLKINEIGCGSGFILEMSDRDLIFKFRKKS